jgi:hypothetical protein
MPANMLLDAPEVQGLHTALGGVNGLADLLVRQVEELLALGAATAPVQRQRWRQCCELVYANRASEVQAHRDSLITSFHQILDALQRAESVADLVAGLAGRDLRGKEELARAVADLKILDATVYSRWQTMEDLEDLAAQHYPLSQERLKTLAQKYPAPASWYAEG